MDDDTINNIVLLTFQIKKLEIDLENVVIRLAEFENRYFKDREEVWDRLLDLSKKTIKTEM